MQYTEVADARDLPGLRLALTKGFPGPWSESAKAILHVKGIDYVPVAQYAAEPNEDLVAWTGRRNAPVAVYNDEPARDGWYQILMLAERLVPEPALLPADSEQRALVVGISNEVVGEEGFCWNRRVMMMMVSMPGGAEADPKSALAQMAREYRISPAAAQAAPERAAGILRMLARRLHAQKTAGSPYLVGPNLTACDIYWACCAGMISPLPADVNPMPEQYRASQANMGPVLAAAADPILFAHRDYIYRTHLKLPLDF